MGGGVVGNDPEVLPCSLRTSSNLPPALCQAPWHRCPAREFRGVRPCWRSSSVRSSADRPARTYDLLELRRSAVFRWLARQAIDRDTCATKRRFVCFDGLAS